MKKTILSALIPVFMATSAAFGTAMLSFDDHGAGGGTATSGSYASTSTFGFDVSLSFTSPPQNSRGLSYWLEVPSALAPFITITGEQYFTFLLGTDTSSTKTFTDSSGADSTGSCAGGCMTDKSINFSGDLGAVTSDGSTVAPGTYKVSTLTFSLTGAPAGTYTLQSTTLSPKTSESTQNVSGQFTDFPLATTQYVITVVPEPATLSLLGLGSLGSFGLTVLRARRLKV